jgi:hypothetical protein
VDLSHCLLWTSELKSTKVYNIKLKILNIHIAAAVVWLCSDVAAFMVGHAMVIDGGQTVQRKHFKCYKINEVDTIKITDDLSGTRPL